MANLCLLHQRHHTQLRQYQRKPWQHNRTRKRLVPSRGQRVVHHTQAPMGQRSQRVHIRTHLVPRPRTRCLPSVYLQGKLSSRILLLLAQGSHKRRGCHPVPAQVRPLGTTPFVDLCVVSNPLVRQWICRLPQAAFLPWICQRVSGKMQRSETADRYVLAAGSFHSRHILFYTCTEHVRLGSRHTD